MKANFFFMCYVFFSIQLSAQVHPRQELDRMIDAWHHAAAVNDQHNYFEFIDDSGIYIGTDSSEIWTREEFYDWSTPIFEKENGWSFQVKSRNIYLADNQEIAWFDEILEYGKGALRGSGVLIKRDQGWRIIHYVLSVPVPNEKYKEVMNLIGSVPIIQEGREK